MNNKINAIITYSVKLSNKGYYHEKHLYNFDINTNIIKIAKDKIKFVKKIFLKILYNITSIIDDLNYQNYHNFIDNDYLDIYANNMKLKNIKKIKLSMSIFYLEIFCCVIKTLTLFNRIDYAELNDNSIEYLKINNNSYISNLTIYNNKIKYKINYNTRNVRDIIQISKFQLIFLPNNNNNNIFYHKIDNNNQNKIKIKIIN